MARLQSEARLQVEMSDGQKEKKRTIWDALVSEGVIRVYKEDAGPRGGGHGGVRGWVGEGSE